MCAPQRQRFAFACARLVWCVFGYTEAVCKCGYLFVFVLQLFVVAFVRSSISGSIGAGVENVCGFRVCACVRRCRLQRKVIGVKVHN